MPGWREDREEPHQVVKLEALQGPGYTEVLQARVGVAPSEEVTGGEGGSVATLLQRAGSTRPEDSRPPPPRCKRSPGTCPEPSPQSPQPVCEG